MHLISPVLGVGAAFMLPLQAPIISDHVYKSHCLVLQNTLHLENTTILDTAYLAAPTNVSTPPGSCQSTALVSAAPLCRVQFVVNTTASSSVRAEAWLPDVWYGRMLGLGNGNLEGCIDYLNLDYGSSLHFASISSDNGHSGGNAESFLHHPEVLNDFAYRATHVEAVIGKQIIHAYYRTPAAHSYYLGCSQGGRQGTQAALRFPGDFDGIVAGAPATDFNHLFIWQGIMSRAVGAPMQPEAPPSAKWLSPELWGVVSAEILRQCDALDGVVDGIIAEPDECDFRPEALLCPPGPAGDINANASNSECLTPTQVEAVKRIYTPLFGVDGQLVYPRYTPGAEADPRSLSTFGGDIFPLTLAWGRFAILNDTNATLSDLSIWDVPLWDSINPGGIATFDGDFSAFRNRGGKFLTYNGQRDPITPSTNAKRVYDLISRTLSLPTLDSFYRLFLIPGMGHCFGGLERGAPSFGQSGGLNAVNDSAHNVLLALVDWVEGGVAPDTIVGSGVGGATRMHCRYPMRSVFDGTAFVCVP